MLTSNRTRDVHDALKRRCLYHWIAHPDFERELAIVRVRAPEVPELLARQVAAAVEALRELELYKPPGVAETIDWANALAALGSTHTRRAHRRRHARHRAQVPRGPGAHARARRRGARRARRWSGVPEPRSRPSVRPSSRSRGRLRPPAARRRSRRAGRRHDHRSPRRSAAVGVDRRSAVYWAGRATLRAAPGGHRMFDRAFAAWFDGGFEVGARQHGRTRAGARVRRRRRRRAGVRRRRRTRTSRGDTLSVRYSRAEVLRHRDFALYTPAEFAEARRLMADLRLTGALRRSRRTRPERRRSRPPRSAAHGAPRAAHRRRADPPRVRRAAGEAAAAGAALRRQRIDGALRPGAGALPARRGGRARDRVEAFALGTRLTRITRELSSRDPDAALAAAARRVVDWSGGTRLGEGLRQFNDEWGVRGMARGAVVVILSDGWDRGDPEVLGRADGPAAPGGAPRRVGEPAQGVARLRAARSGNGGRPARTLTSSSRATRSPSLEHLAEVVAR